MEGKRVLNDILENISQGKRSLSIYTKFWTLYCVFSGKPHVFGIGTSIFGTMALNLFAVNVMECGDDPS